ncbi:hypothetical protein CPAR01_10586, partial [Colletotrichum paranaense]
AACFSGCSLQYSYGDSDRTAPLTFFLIRTRPRSKDVPTKLARCGDMTPAVLFVFPRAGLPGSARLIVAVQHVLRKLKLNGEVCSVLDDMVSLDAKMPRGYGGQTVTSNIMGAAST